MDDLKSTIHAYLDDELTDDQHRALEAWIRQSPDNRKGFVTECYLHSQLQDILAGERTARDVSESAASESESSMKAAPSFVSFDESGVSGVFGRLGSGWPVAYLVATVVLGIGLVVGRLVHVSQPMPLAQKGTALPAPVTAQPAFVGRITGMVDCQWADPKTAVPGPVAVPLGRRYELASGLLEIRYDTGAKVILQGPCVYEVESAAGGFLTRGKLTARVEKKKERRTKNEQLSESRSSLLIPHCYFAITTPTAIVTDLGTEFGVEVSEAGVTETQVFAGRVKLAGRSGDSQSGGRLLAAGEAARLDPRVGTVETVAASTADFVRTMPVLKTAASRELIGQIDYSDSFTVNSPTRPGSNLMLRELMLTDPNVLRVEQAPGNPLRSWDVPGGTAILSWPKDAHWPGFQVQGSRSGLLEASGDCHCGFEYNLRDDFVVQFDAVQTADFINITIGESAHYTHDTPSLSVFVRAAGTPRTTPFFRVPGAPTPTPGVLAPSIGIYHPQKGEIDTGLHSGISTPHGWHNYAVRFDLPAKRLTVWIDRECRGTIDLDTLKDTEGRPALEGLTWTRRCVSIGGFSPADDKRKVWFDNFRVGIPRDQAGE